MREWPLLAAGSTDRCNTFCELLSRRLIEQGLSRPFIELSCDSTELSLAVQGQICATWKILTQQSLSVFVLAALRGRSRITKVDLDPGRQCQALMVGELLASVP